MSMNTRSDPRSNQSLEAVSNPEVDGLSATGVIIISFEDNVVDRPVIHTDGDHVGGVTGVILVFSVASKDSQVVADLVGRLNEVTPLLISAGCCSGCTADVPAGHKATKAESAHVRVKSGAKKSGVGSVSSLSNITLILSETSNLETVATVGDAASDGSILCGCFGDLLTSATDLVGIRN